MTLAPRVHRTSPAVQADTRAIPLRVAYLLYNERVSDGLIATQVVRLLAEIKRQSPAIELTLVSFLPPWVSLRERESLGAVGAMLRRRGVGFEVHHVALPYRLFLYGSLRVRAMRRLMFHTLRALLAGRFDVVHARGYFPGLLAADLQHAIGIRSVFDPRSFFPEEQLGIGTWDSADRGYRLWKEWERWTLDRADAAVGVSEPMVAIQRQIAPSARAELIYCCVDLDEFRPDPVLRRRLRGEFGWGERPVICYEGRLDKWNDVSVHLAYFRWISRLRPDACFLVLTQSTGLDFESLFRDAGIERRNYHVRRVQPSELGGWLSVGDIGQQAMGRVPDRATRLGVKFVEYLSCGLPVICNSNVGGAAEVVRKHSVGIVVDLAEHGGDDRLGAFLAGERPSGDHCRRVAQELFSVEVCAGRYLDVYTAREPAGPSARPVPVSGR